MPKTVKNFIEKLPNKDLITPLAAQAAAAVRLFTGASVSEKELQDAYGSLLRRVRNIVLIGMPGCGKTATGSELCKLTGMRHIDCDTEFEKRCNCTIPEYFARYGEAAFRKLETEILVDITKAGGSIISTGGGVILRPENYRLLHQNGVIVFLDRSISELPTDGRPLSQAGSLYDMAEKRLPLYRSWCDLTVSGSSAAECATQIMEALK